MKISYLGKQIYPRTKVGRFTSIKSSMRYYAGWTWFWSKVSVAAAVLVIGTYGYTTFEQANTVYAQNVIVSAKDQMAPVLQRIADCESGNGNPNTGHQFNKDGTIVHHVNANGTTDVGMWQINMNEGNIEIMVKHNFNVLTEDGNHAMAVWLYENVGTGPWMSSYKCWK